MRYSLPQKRQKSPPALLFRPQSCKLFIISLQLYGAAEKTNIQSVSLFSAAPWVRKGVIVNNIHVNPGICGLEYGDLFQEGCLWLCKAAFTYNAGQAQFSTYAKKVVKNGLLSYCRKICSQGRHISRLIIGEQGELAADGEQVDQPDDHFDSHLSRLETLDLLEASKQNYQGVARLGIEALALKVQGMRITDIAALYQVPPSHVGAWISRSLEKLRNDPDFLTCLL